MADLVLQEWQAFFDNADQPSKLRPVILASWKRCIRAGLSRAPTSPLFRRVPSGELSRRLEESAGLRREAMPHLRWLSATFSRQTHAVYITDADGIVLAALGQWPGGLAALGLEPGNDWSEATMGTNGAGSAIAADQPVAVIGNEHYNTAFERCTCTGAPIHAPDGRVVGAVDLSVPADQGRPEYLLLTAHIAFVIDQALKASAQAAEAESLKLLARLSGFTAHELASPLTSIQNALGVLDRQPAPSDTARRMIDIIARSSRQLNRAVDDFRTLGRGAADDTFVETDLVALAGALCEDIDGSVKTRIHVPDAPLHVMCHEGLLSRALGNLIRNAREALSDTGTIGIDIERLGSHARISVWDDGPGVPPEKRGRLFDESFTTKDHGSGLGLLLTRAIVEHLHGGRLSYAPNEPCGSRFQIDLPLS